LHTAEAKASIQKQTGYLNVVKKQQQQTNINYTSNKVRKERNQEAYRVS
jgi:hypothetical protein